MQAQEWIWLGAALAGVLFVIFGLALLSGRSDAGSDPLEDDDEDSGVELGDGGR